MMDFYGFLFIAILLILTPGPDFFLITKNTLSHDSGCTNERFLNQIICGDSIELLQQLGDNSVDAVITDPPYCSGGQTANARAKTSSSKYEQSDIVHRPDFVGDTMDQHSWICR